ncbi:Bacterial alpha-L-rhamnosidase [compost metagenome]
MAGIQSVSAGFSAVRIRPYLPPGLALIEASVPTPFGVIRGAWDRSELSVLKIQLSIPVGVEAQVVLTEAGIGQDINFLKVREGIHTVWERQRYLPGVSGIISCEYSFGEWVLTLSSGDYSLTILQPELTT